MSKSRLTAASGSPTSMTVETKFMQNYRVASAVNAGIQVFAATNGAGQTELFTVGTDGTVWNFYPDPASVTGYSGITTNLSGSAVAAGLDANGNLVVFAANGLQLSYVVEDRTSSTRWSKPSQVEVPRPLNPTRIAGIYASNIAGMLYVGVLTQFTSAMGALYSLSLSTWNSTNPSFTLTSMNLASLNCVWLGSTPATAAFACIDNIIVSYNASTRQVTRWRMAAPFASLSVDASSDGSGQDEIFAILADGNAYHLTGGGSSPYSWVQLSQGMTFRQIGAVTDASGSVQAFAVSGDNRLCHWEPTSATPSGYSYPPASIYLNVASIGIASNDDGDIDVFAIGTSQNSLTHIYQELETTNWTAQAVEVPTSGQVEEYISYSSDVTLYDAAGTLLVNTPVYVWATEAARITVNGATYFVDPKQQAKTSTNAAGMLSISQETGMLSVPSVQFTLPTVMSPGESITIDQYSVTQSQLASVTGTDLMDAKDAEGNYLIPDKYRTAQTTASMASAFNQCMQLSTVPAGAHAFMTRGQPKRGVWLTPAGAAPDFRRIGKPPPRQHWRLAMTGTDLVYQELTQAEASARVAELRATSRSAADIFSWVNTIGDFFAEVSSGVATVVETVVNTVAEGIQAVFNFVVNGISYVFESVITFVEQAFDVVMTIFAQVSVAFEKVFEWLGFIFDWNDILLTHEALVYTINTFIGFLQGATTGIQAYIDTGINTVQSQISSLFDQAVATIAGSATIGGYVEDNEPDAPDYTEAMSNNIVYNNLIDNASGATSSRSISSTLASFASSDATQDFLRQLQSLVDTTEATSAFSSATEYFQNLGSSPDTIMSQLFAGMLRIAEGVIQAIISGVQTVVDSLLQLISSMIASLQSVLNEQWDIPFVSQFYSWLTNGSSLTTIDLLALITAIPATIIYKLVYGTAPFTSQADVTAFEQSFTASSMLAASGLGGTGVRALSALAADSSGLLPQNVACMLGIAGGVATCVLGLLSAITDASKSPPNILSQSSLVLEYICQATSFPWFTESGTPDCTTATGSSMMLWLFGCVGVGLSTFFTVTTVTPDTETVASFIYAVGHCIPSIIASLHADGLTVAGNIVPLIPELGKLLGYSSIVAATGGISLLVLAALDALGGITSGVITIVQATGTSDPAPVQLAAVRPTLAVASL
jgi:hypothetical protein